MSVSQALEISARNFSVKYACNFDFAAFESSVEEFTFFRPNNGWIDVYKMIFDRMYKKTLEKVAIGAVHDLNGEAMLDDFEYTLIRPYVQEREDTIKHKPYVGMDRITRLEYLDRLTKEAPANPVELCTQKYKIGELSLGQMRRRARSTLWGVETERKRYIEIASYIQALEAINQSRALVWRLFHPFRNKAERSDAARMKGMFLSMPNGGESFYREIVAAAYETFDGHKKANGTIEQRILHAKEEQDQLQKMNGMVIEPTTTEDDDH